jgi:hypothetical protein
MDSTVLSVPQRDEQGPTHRVHIPCVIGSDWLAEQLYDKQTGVAVFCVRNPDRTISTASSVPHTAGLTAHPVNGELVKKGFVLFPHQLARYGTQDELEQRIRQHIRRGVALSPTAESVCVAYVLYTWLFERFTTAPYLHAIGDMGAGKSVLLEVLGGLCNRGILMAGGTTLSALFRTIDQFRGTLIFDETDFSSRSDDHHEVMRMLRTGFKKGPGLMRTEGGPENWTVRCFDVFGPKIVAGRWPFPDDALESRCVPIYMRVGVDSVLYREELSQEYHQAAAELRAQLLQWRFDHMFAPLARVDGERFEGRVMQVYRPLATVTATREIRDALKSAVGHMQIELTDARHQSPEGRVLQAVFKLASKGTTRLAKLYMSQISDETDTGDQERLSPRRVSAVCKGFRILPTKDRMGRFILFDLDAHATLLARYGIGTESSEAQTRPLAA